MTKASISQYIYVSLTYQTVSVHIEKACQKWQSNAKRHVQHQTGKQKDLRSHHQNERRRNALVAKHGGDADAAQLQHDTHTGKADKRSNGVRLRDDSCSRNVGMKHAERNKERSYHCRRRADIREQTRLGLCARLGLDSVTPARTK